MTDNSSTSHARPKPPPLVRSVSVQPRARTDSGQFLTTAATNGLDAGAGEGGPVSVTRPSPGPAVSAQAPNSDPSAPSELRPANVPTNDEVDMGAAREAFRLLYRRLQALPPYEVQEPCLRVSDTLAEAADLSRLLVRPAIGAALVGVGLSSNDLGQLTLAARALIYVETCVRNAQTNASATLARLEHAARLRDELRLSCQWNLRGGAHAEALARITDSDDPGEIALDLNELVQLLSTHWQQFASDQTLELSTLVPHAQRVAQQLAAMPTALSGVKGEWLDLRARAYTHLVAVIRLLREAGRYAFRGNAALRSAFSEPPSTRRRYASLSGRVRSGIR